MSCSNQWVFSAGKKKPYQIYFKINLIWKKRVYVHAQVITKKVSQCYFHYYVHSISDQHGRSVFIYLQCFSCRILRPNSGVCLLHVASSLYTQTISAFVSFNVILLSVLCAFHLGCYTNKISAVVCSDPFQVSLLHALHFRCNTHIISAFLCSAIIQMSDLRLGCYITKFQPFYIQT